MLIDVVGHHEAMLALILIPVLAVAALLIFAMGADSRVDEVTRRRGFNG